MALYQPEGTFGPICDSGSSAIAEAAGVAAVAEEVDDDGFVTLDPPDGRPRPANEYTNWPLQYKCKERILEDGTREFYDCQMEFQDLPDLGYNGTTCLFDHGSCFNWEAESKAGFGIDDNFFVPVLGPQACVPYRPDINIRPTDFVGATGVTTRKYARERSTPVTYAVNGSVEDVDVMEVAFDITGTKLVVTGPGGAVELELEWDDNPSNAGTAVTSITINGVTWTQSGESGSERKTVTLAADTEYPLTFVGLNAANNANQLDVRDGLTRLCLYDGDGTDCNASFRITNFNSGLASAVSLWGENGDNYGVWTNPELCTLPCIPQEVTYTINFPSTDTYYFEFGADDSGRFFIDEEAQPVLDIEDGISNLGRYRDPWVASRTITAGNHKITVQCTNNNSLFVESNDYMQYAKNTLLIRIDETEERGDFGFDRITNFNYFSPIARAVADEYLSGRFGRTESTPGEYASRGRPPEPTGLATHVNYYLAQGGSLSDDPVDPTIWANTKTNSIIVGYNLGENNAANVLAWYRPSCSTATPNGLLDTEYNSTAYEWRYNPGGWFLKICQGGPCGVVEQLDWVRVSHAAWNTFMNTYAIWPESDNPLAGVAQSITHKVVIPTSGTYTLQYACDNTGIWYWNGVQVATYSSFTTTGSTSFTATPGVYNLRMDVTNISQQPVSTDIWANNPAGGAWLLTNSNGGIIKSSADLESGGSGNLFWHTRLATGYEYIEN